MELKLGDQVRITELGLKKWNTLKGYNILDATFVGNVVTKPHLNAHFSITVHNPLFSGRGNTPFGINRAENIQLFLGKESNYWYLRAGEWEPLIPLTLKDCM